MNYTQHLHPTSAPNITLLLHPTSHYSCTQHLIASVANISLQLTSVQLIIVSLFQSRFAVGEYDEERWYEEVCVCQPTVVIYATLIPTSSWNVWHGTNIMNVMADLRTDPGKDRLLERMIWYKHNERRDRP